MSLEENENNRNEKLKKGGFLDKLKKLQQKQANQQNKKQGKTTIADQLEQSVDNIEKYNQDLRKAIELSEGKEASVEKEQK